MVSTFRPRRRTPERAGHDLLRFIDRLALLDRLRLVDGEEFGRSPSRDTIVTARSWVGHGPVSSSAKILPARIRRRCRRDRSARRGSCSDVVLQENGGPAVRCCSSPDHSDLAAGQFGDLFDRRRPASPGRRLAAQDRHRLTGGRHGQIAPHDAPTASLCRWRRPPPPARPSTTRRRTGARSRPSWPAMAPIRRASSLSPVRQRSAAPSAERDSEP